MSAEHVGWAFRQDVGSPTRKLVLVALADRCNKDSLQCNPHIETLAADCNLGERATRQALADLCDLGFITRERARRRDGSMSGYDYSFPNVREGAQPPAPDAAGEGDLPAGGAARPPAGDAGLEGNREVLNREGTTEPENLPAAAPPYDPLKGTLIDGQNLPWNALATAIGGVSKIDGSRMRRALDSIRADIHEWALAQFGPIAFVREIDAVEYERGMATMIEGVARALREDAPTLTWGPEGVARNFRRGMELVIEEKGADAVDRIVAEARGLRINPDPLRVVKATHRCRVCRQYAPRCRCPMGASYEEVA